MNERDIFHAALEIADPARRSAHLEQACGGDAALRQRLEGLLAMHAKAGNFLEAPAGLGKVNAGPNPERESTVLGPYKLLQKIGEGGMGTVYMAEQQQPLRRTVAVKILKPGMDTRQIVARFEAERQALALMDHPNIGRVLDGGETPSGHPYFVMELVKGVPITRYCDDHQLTPRERIQLFASACAAVQHAHQKGIIHRDLKPSNVLVAAYDGRPVPKLIDFGVAKAVGQPLTERTLVTGFGTIVGTLEYMSPEQAEFNALDIDTRADIYSLGVLLYELLTGTTPLTHARLKEAAMTEALRLIREEDPPKPSMRLSDSKDTLVSISAHRKLEPARLTREVRGELDWIVMKALEKDRNRRYDSAGLLALDLERYLNDEPVEACPPSLAYRCRKFARRHRTGLGVAGLVLSCVILLVGAAGWLVRDQAARTAVLENEVSLALEEAQAFYHRDQQPQAMSAVKRAEALVAQGQIDEKLLRSVRQWRTDLDMVARVEKIRLDAAAVKDASFDNAAAGPAYRKAFADFGLDLTALEHDVAAERIRTSAVSDHLVAALDDWIWHGPKAGPPEMSHLMAIARAADADAWRNKLRDALERRDGAYLESLAKHEQAQSLPPATLLRLAKAAAALGRLELAIQVLRPAQQRHENDFWINHELGRYLCLATPAQPREAVGYLRAASAIRPGNAGVHNNLGIALFLQNDWADAEAEARTAIRLKPDYAEAYTGLGVALYAQRKYVAAEVEFRNAIRFEPNSVKGHFNLARALISQGRVAEAIVELNAALRLKPDHADSLANLGGALAHERQIDEGIAKLREAIRIKPNLSTAHFFLAEILGSQNQLDEALHEYQEAVRCEPTWAAAHNDLGTALWQKGRHEDAMAEYGKALVIEPGDIMARYNLGLLLFGKRRFDEAMTHYREVLRLDPKHPQAHFGLGNVLRERGKLDDAVAEYRLAIEFQPNFPNAHYQLGTALEKQGNLEQAADCYRKALKHMPGFVEAQRSLRNVENALKAKSAG